ncbi:inositol monophosphatase family protein [Nostoc sp. UCD121]|uniref:inositol monophosphatase family protein n=1 Tax=unclassified Nostoc TaxID=2593658 RepID=UPI0016261672|nr:MULTISPECIES: inositol monophosphatase family protein [unclassified Nostoc]MBC1220841.1 inositol monophosphatase family protein [Nostoc sp. UCD120]MBC1276958.1 inositol monophosphatase family protein [Nostoc sp. UCD121]MBC1293941.1 inositol monophosphatase family protein [Nostoc sp. UCD122]
MSTTPTTRLILETLLPHLKVAAAYAHFLQPKIAALPAKGEGNNFFSAALTDADVAIQNLVEVVLLGTFPNIRFYGEEYASSNNTKYFRATELGSEGDYLVTLDPIDGTKFYMDGHSNYQIILSILNSDDFEAVIAISPAQNIYFYALRGEGAFKGTLEMSLEACAPLNITSAKPAILLGWAMNSIGHLLKDRYQVIDIATDYSSDIQIPNLNGILTGDLSGAVIKSGKFIDVAALAFIVKEAGWIVTTLDGSTLPPLHTCQNYSLPGLIIATSKSVHQDLLKAMQSLPV